MSIEFDSFDVDEFDGVSEPKVKPLSNKNAPPAFNYDKKRQELYSYNTQVDHGSDISEIIVYLEELQRSRSRVIELEAEAERNYLTIDLTYDILEATEYLNRTEKTQKEKEAATLKKLQNWAEAQSEAKIYSMEVKKVREQIDATHHILTKILNAKQLEVHLKTYEGKSKQQDDTSFDTTTRELESW